MNTLEAASLILRPVEPGPETAMLAHFHRDGTWRGVIHAGGRGPVIPEQVAIALPSTTGFRTDGGGRRLPAARARRELRPPLAAALGVRWDPFVQEYWATIADNCVRADALRGRIEGDVMVFEPIGTGLPRLRLTWDASAADQILWRNEMTADGENWVLVEDYRIIPTVDEGEAH